MCKNRVVAIVVTYNRKNLLSECLNAIEAQTIAPSKVIVINNASTDGTEKMFERGGEFAGSNIYCVNMSKNTGGSGGFYEGLKRIMEEDADWAWIMDDDTIPTQNCLENLLIANDIVSGKKGDGHVSFYASTVFGADGEFMNVPSISKSKAENGYSDYYEFLGDSLLKIADATFVSLLISTDAIRMCGLPCKDYFIWGDDGEYTLRLTHYYGAAYMVGNSVAIHKRVGAKTLSIANFVEPKRIKMYHYYIRNNIINILFYKKDKNAAVVVLKKFSQALASVKLLGQKYGFLKMRVIWKGTFEGFFQYGHFKKYIKSQLKDT